MLYWGKLICWILLLRRTVSCSAAGPLPGLKFSSGLSLSEPKPYKIFQQTTKNQATAREKRFPTFATVNLPLWCRTKDHRQRQPPRLAGHLRVARLCAALQLEQTTQRWTVGLLAVSWTSWRTLRSSASHERRETRFAAENWPVCHDMRDTRRNRLCGHGGYRGTTPQCHAPRVDSASFLRQVTGYDVKRYSEAWSAFGARLRSGR